VKDPFVDVAREDIEQIRSMKTTPFTHCDWHGLECDWCRRWRIGTFMLVSFLTALFVGLLV
jgi:hypothetical protein